MNLGKRYFNKLLFSRLLKIFFFKKSYFFIFYYYHKKRFPKYIRKALIIKK